MTLTSEQIRQRFLDYFAERDHKIIPSASLVPENDPSVLFTTAGMQPLVPYLLGDPHPKGKRLANSQRCLRTNDIEEVGDESHLTFFEMLGNWSLGDYFKEEAISWSLEFLTSDDRGLGLEKNRLYVTVFEGDENADRDDESIEIWRSVGIPDHRIYTMPASENWWPEPKAGDESSGPCGPDTEIYYDVTEEGIGDLSKEDFIRLGDEGSVIEIWNNVFMEYRKEAGKVAGKLEQHNVDTGMGLERLTAVIQQKQTVFETDLFAPLIGVISNLEPETATALTDSEKTRARRVIADHIRASVFIINDGVTPSNTDAGYILRRLLRRSIQYADTLGLPTGALSNEITTTIIHKYEDVYPSLTDNTDTIQRHIDEEEQKFRKTLEGGLKEFNKISNAGDEISGEDAFILFSTYGMPIEMVEELAEKQGRSVDHDGFKQAFRAHQELSKAGAGERFKGGLAGTGNKMELRYHTATHLLNAALRKVLGEHVSQKGSNITSERLRFDFNHPEKMTDEQKTRVEELVNKAIQDDLPVSFEELPLQEAYDQKAIGVFGETYPDTVKVYTIGDNEKGILSKEICGGPHVERTGDLEGNFRIKKEESVSAGVRRIKAVIE